MSELYPEGEIDSDPNQFFGPHELHVTADPQTTDPEHFKEACTEIGVKDHVIYNEMPTGETIVDYLTGSAQACTSADAFKELERIASGLRTAGLDVVREKIETTPWHPAAPKSDSDTRGPGSYFESHFTLPDLPTTHGWKLLQWGGEPFYISTTDNKRREGLLFATMRHYESTSAEFVGTIGKLYTALAAQVDVKQPTVEFSMYDSNPDHDKEWVDAYRALRARVAYT